MQTVGVSPLDTPPTPSVRSTRSGSACASRLTPVKRMWRGLHRPHRGTSALRLHERPPVGVQWATAPVHPGLSQHTVPCGSPSAVHTVCQGAAQAAHQLENQTEQHSDLSRTLNRDVAVCLGGTRVGPRPRTTRPHGRRGNRGRCRRPPMPSLRRSRPTVCLPWASTDRCPNGHRTGYLGVLRGRRAQSGCIREGRMASHRHRLPTHGFGKPSPIATFWRVVLRIGIIFDPDTDVAALRVKMCALNRPRSPGGAHVHPSPRKRHIDVERWLVTLGTKQADWRLEVEILPPSSHDTLIHPVGGLWNTPTTPLHPRVVPASCPVPDGYAQRATRGPVSSQESCVHTGVLSQSISRVGPLF